MTVFSIKSFTCPFCGRMGPWHEFKDHAVCFGLPFRCPQCFRRLYRVWNLRAPLAYIAFAVGLVVLWRIRTVSGAPLDILWVLGFHNFYIHNEGWFIGDLRGARKFAVAVHVTVGLLLLMAGTILFLFGLSVFSRYAF